MTFSTLRRDFPQWVYRRFAAKLQAEVNGSTTDLVINFEFGLAERVFRPQLVIENVPAETQRWLHTPTAQAYLLHLGLIELISYWKATCSPEIVIEAGYLSQAQLAWWRELWVNGLGEFWYQNQIDPSQPDLVKFTVTAPLPSSSEDATAGTTGNPGAPGQAPDSTSSTGAARKSGPSPEKLLIPVGGGKDSAAVLGWLAEQKRAFSVLLLLPNSPAAAAVTKASQAEETIVLRRTLDPQLKELNAQGFLNGHTPFSAYLGWASVLAAEIFGYGQVAVANEQSANEGNVAYHGLTVNHQYSKTTHYEAAFREYLRTFFEPLYSATASATSSATPAASQPPNYFSLWRPLHELQIARLFSKYPEFFPLFKSCNVNQQKGTWCHHCAKCVFVYTILAPFIEPSVLQNQIFEHDLFEDESLVPLWLQLLGYEAHKPFECVGTQQEVLVALATVIDQYQARSQKLPVVLAKLQEQANLKTALASAPKLEQLLGEFASPHFLSHELEMSLRRSLGQKIGQVDQVQKLEAWRAHPSVKALRGQRIVLVGLGREGWSSYRWFRQVWPQQKLTLADQRSASDLGPEWTAALASDPLSELVTGPDYLQAVADQDILFMTPGIRTDQPAILAAIAAGARLHSQTQLFFELCPGKIIGITGTKGKSTTSSLIFQVLQTGGLPSVLAGNIGTPFLDKLGEITAETLVVAELSCHQLQHLTRSPHIAVIQNIAPEHLDYYPTFEAYVAAKSAIARFQGPDDKVIFQRSFAVTAGVAKLGQAQQLTYRIDPVIPVGSVEPELNQTPPTEGKPNTDIVWLADEALWLKQPVTSDSTAIKVISTADVPLLGHHNLYNVAPAIVVGTQFGIKPEFIAAAIRQFHSLPHRLQKIASVGGVDYYDDSLSSNPHATVAALASFGGRPIVLIAGGYERHQEFEALAEAILQNSVKGLVLFPTTGERLWQQVKEVFAAKAPTLPLPKQVEVKSMAAAVAAAQSLAQPGDVVLLSPASASFGLFADYHDRGVQFAEAVKTINL